MDLVAITFSYAVCATSFETPPKMAVFKCQTAEVSPHQEDESYPFLDHTVKTRGRCAGKRQAAGWFQP